MSRLTPLPREQLGELESTFQTFRKSHGLRRQQRAHHGAPPQILQTLGALARAILEGGAVPLSLKSCICQIASWTTGCLYCQAHFANNMLRSGVAPEKLENLWDFERSALFSAAERAALRFAVAASQVPNGVTDEHFVELKRHWDDGQIVEILATICYVGFLNRWNDSLATTLEEIPAQAAADTLAPRAGKRASTAG